MAIHNYVGGSYSRTKIDAEAGSMQVNYVGVPWVHKHGNWGASDSYRAGVYVDTRGYDYMYWNWQNEKFRFISIETDSTLTELLAAGLPAHDAADKRVWLRNRAAAQTGAYAGVHELKWHAVQATEDGGTQIILERNVGRWPDPQFRSDWSFWPNYFTLARQGSLTNEDGSVVHCALNRTGAGQFYGEDVAGNSTINNSNAAYNWPDATKFAYGRSSAGNASQKIRPYMPYRQMLKPGGSGDVSGIGGASQTFGQTDLYSSDLAENYPFDSWARSSREAGNCDMSAVDYLQPDGSALATYTGTAGWDMSYMQWSKDKYHPCEKVTDSTGIYWAAGVGLGFLDNLPDAIWLAPSPYNTGSALTVATAGWSANGSYTYSPTVNDGGNDINRDGDTSDTNEWAAKTVKRHNLVEVDVQVLLYKRAHKS